MPVLWYSVPLTPQQATVNPYLCQRLLETHRQVWLGQTCRVTPPFSWYWCTQGFFVPSKGLLAQSFGSSVIKSH